MTALFMKIWSISRKKKALKASSIQEFKQKGASKLEFEEEWTSITIYMDDGTEIDDDDILFSLPEGTVLYLCRPGEIPGQYDVNPGGIHEDSISSVDPQCSSPRPTDVIDNPARAKKSSWPKCFEISFGKFPAEVHYRATKGMTEMNWQARHELLRTLAEDIMRYTVDPDMQQRHHIVEALLKQYPKLRSSIGNGTSGWAQRIYDKMKDARRKLDTPETKAQLRPMSGTVQMKMPHRGEANWAPSFCNESSEVEASRTWMIEESLKPQNEHDRQKIESCLKLTFPAWRSLFNQKPSLALLEMKNMYPLLFTSHGLRIEFQILQNLDPMKLINTLCTCAETIIKLADKDLPLTQTKRADLHSKRVTSRQIRVTALKRYKECEPCGYVTYSICSVACVIK